MQTPDQTPFAERETRLTGAVTWGYGLKAQDFEGRETQREASVGMRNGRGKKSQRRREALLAQKLAHRQALARQSTQPISLQRQRRRSLVILATVILCLTCLGLFIGPPLARVWFPPAA